MGALSSLLQQGAVNTALRERIQLAASSHSSMVELPLQPLPATPDTTPHNSGLSEKFPTVLEVEDEAHGKVTLRSLGVSTGSEEDDMPLIEEGSMFPGMQWPAECVSPLLKAGWFFSLLACQLITHAHFDHILAMVLATGSLPPRSLPPYPPGSLPSDKPVRIQVYAQRNVLEKISTVYDGEVWPELGAWAGRPIPPGDTILGVGSGLSGIKSRLEGMMDSLIHPKDDGNRTDDGLGERFNKEHNGGSEELGRQKPARQSYASMEGIGIQYCPMPSCLRYQRLPISGISRTDPTRRIGLSALHMPVVHGNTSRGTYESSAFFVNADACAATQDMETMTTPPDGPEILFWGDVESTIDEDVRVEDATDVNIRVWREAAIRWNQGRLGAVFIECSYASDRPCHLMFGHLRPQSLYAELVRLSACVSLLQAFSPSASSSSSSSSLPSPLPLAGLKIYIIHVKQPLKPDPSGLGIMTLIKRELDELEGQARGKGEGLGVEFIMMKRGMRIVV